MDTDVQQLVLVKEAPGEDQQDPEHLHIKEDQEELWTSLEGDHLHLKEETDAARFPVTVVSIKSEDDEEKPLISQLHQQQIEDRDVPTSSSAGGGAGTSRNQDLNHHEQTLGPSEAEVSGDDEEDDDMGVDSELSHAGSETGDDDWNERRSSESDGCASSRSPGQDLDWNEAGWQPNKIPFTATSGPRNAAADLDCDVPAKFLELFLTDELLDHIVHQTNLYASQYFQAHPDLPHHSRGNAWKPVSVSELKTFFGLTFLTGYVKKPSTEMYWSVDEVDATPYFNRTMSRNRFEIIWKFLHYNDNNANLDGMDKMYKVRPVLDYIVGRFRQMYQPDKNICIGEGMMLWRGCPSFRVYSSQKPVEYGIKSYILCDSATGYCFNMRPYFGEDSSLPDTVFSLLDRLSGHGYTLYMDNFYNSVALCERLLEAQTNVCGTLRWNRGEPQVIRDLVKNDIGTGDKVVRHNDKVMVVAWQDKRLVKMVTTCHQDGMQKVDVWQKGHKDKVAQFKPECVVAYNSHMNGVAKLDQNISYYPFIRRSLNWSKKFVAYLFQMCMFNAYILYRARNPGGCNTLLKFIRSVVKSWTLKGHERKGSEVREQVEEEEGAGVEDGDLKDVRHTPRAPYNTDPESRLDGDLGRHKLCYLKPTSKKLKPTKRCRVCIRRGTRRETKMMCRACCVPLHAGQCYIDYHTKEKYSVQG
ncbi:piggyBac transposable element-derived protein 4 isoform X2 [Nothobranchius furzeri]|uniref:piggyBac transposable element-derived protein 4 isoform X2 n=1 Tax=Nothobranchius furzeri TaxID=105023 RepID=UPI0039046D56